MTTSTQAMNNVNKVQTPSTNNKPSPGKQEPELNFNDLFSSALGQSAPKAQLNSIETQLRESLFKQDKPKKTTDNNANAEAAQAAQAAVWAQRNWMQTTPVPAQQDTQQATQPAPVSNTEPAKQTDAPENTERTRDNSATPANSGTTPKTAETTEPAKATSTAPPPETSEQTPEQGASILLASNTTAPVVREMPLDGKAALAPELSQTTANSGNATTTAASKTSDLTAALPSAEQSNPDNQARTDNTRPEIKTTAQLKADAALSNSTVNVRADFAPGNTPGNAGNANAIAAQLAPQIAQQAQAMGEGFGEEGLKVGQKILAAGNLQASGLPNGIAAGTNGLTGSTGIAQQALIKTPVNQPGFAKELGQTVQWAIGKNLSTVDIRVNPETFGPMNMRLVQKGQQVQLVIRTQDEASANLLTQALGGLKEVLAQNGLQLNQVQIQHGNTPQGQANNGQSQFEQNNGQGQRGQQSTGGDNTQQEAAAAQTPATSKKPEGTLDLFA